MDDNEIDLEPDTTERVSAPRFDDWRFETGLPDEDALQRMCRAAASYAVKDLVNDIWLMINFSTGRGASCQKRLEVGLHAWDGAVVLGRPFAEVMRELAENHGYNDGTMADDDPDVLEILRELETAIAMIRGRMRPRENAADR